MTPVSQDNTGVTSVSQDNTGKISNKKINEDIKKKSLSAWNARILTHEKFDARLGDSFIPHFVRPIVSYLGHLIIGICRDKYADTYDKIRVHLESQAATNPTENSKGYLLDNSDLNKIREIFAESFGTFTNETNIADSRLREDFFYLFLHADNSSFENEPNAAKLNYYY